MRYARLYLYFLRFSFSRALEFRLDFTFRIFMDGLWYAVHWAFFWVLFRHTAVLGHWTYDQVLLFMGGVFLADGLQMTIFSNNMWWLPTLINRGDLDYYLVRPISSLFFVSLRDFAANSFVNVLMAAAILTYALARYPAPLGAGAIALYVGLLLVGVFIHYALQMLFLLPTFWMHNASGLRDLFWSFTTLGERPHRIYAGWVRRFLLSVLPFSLIASLPAQGLIEGYSLALVGHILGVAGAFFLVLVFVWRRGLRAYASASS